MIRVGIQNQFAIHSQSEGSQIDLSSYQHRNELQGRRAPTITFRWPLSFSFPSVNALILSIAKPRYDLTTFSESNPWTLSHAPLLPRRSWNFSPLYYSWSGGRLSHFANVTSPLTLLASNTRLQEARDNVDAIESKFPKDRLNSSFLVEKSQAEKYWKDKQLVESSVHPDTSVVSNLWSLISTLHRNRVRFTVQSYWQEN